MSFETINDYLQSSEDYQQSYYVGTVTNNQDPLNMGRVQANVPGLFDAAQGSVPWIGPIKDSPFGFGTGSKGPYGTYGAPQVGSKIRVELQGGDPHHPLYGPLLTAPDANPHFPINAWGFEDPDGNMVIYDLTAHTYKFVTAGGATINIDASGKRITAVNGDVTNSNGDWQIIVQGNASIQASGSASYTASVHNFHGPIVCDNSISAANDITDNTSGVSGTMRGMRQIFDQHRHLVNNVQGGGDSRNSELPVPQIPT